MSNLNEGQKLRSTCRPTSAAASPLPPICKPSKFGLNDSAGAISAGVCFSADLHL